MVIRIIILISLFALTFCFSSSAADINDAVIEICDILGISSTIDFECEFKEGEARYDFATDTIYLPKEATKGMLYHELTHAILCDYFIVPIPRTIHESLAGYVEYKTREN